MADSKISALPASTTPLAGTEVLPIVQSTTTKQVSVANLTAGRAVSALSLTSTTTLGVTGVSTLTGGAVIQGLTVGKGANAVATNTAVGVVALASGSLSGGNNTAVGSSALTALTTGAFNTAIGQGALGGATGANYNTAVGNDSLLANIGGQQNAAFGVGALAGNTYGNFNTAVGVNALQSSTGSQNLALGQGAGSALTTGSNNTIIGSVAGTAGLSDTVIIAAGSAERMRIDSSGNVGIGTNAPEGKVQISLIATDTPGLLVTNNQGNGSYNGGRIRLGTSSAGTYGSDIYQIQNGFADNTGLGFATYTPFVGLTEKMRIDSAGTVTIPGTLSIAAYTETIVASGTVGSTATLAITAGTVLTATLTSATACTFTMPTATAGKSFILLLKQPASGTATTATFTGVKFNSSGAPTITATVGKMDILTFVSDGTNWYGSYSQGYTP